LTFGVTAITLGYGVVEGKYALGYYSMVVSLLIRLFGSFKQFTAFLMSNNWYVKVLDAYFEIIKSGTYDGREQLLSESVKAQDIAMSGLSYCYPQSNRQALDNVSLSIKSGQRIAIVGGNGSGKTTLMSVFLGLLHNYVGEYTNNNQCIAILQDFIQYQTTIKENIEIGCGGDNLSESQVYDILKKVDLYDFIMGLPNGIYTQLGQLNDGIELSKGQWQRLAICRLLANDKSNVWILDEPTAYLDPISEVKLYEMVFKLAGEKTVFFVSHRLGFVKKADRILLLQNGKILQQGTHEDLMRDRCDVYRQMYNAQKGWFVN
jgi:ATP-binding cassette subfamily B protein